MLTIPVHSDLTKHENKYGPLTARTWLIGSGAIVLPMLISIWCIFVAGLSLNDFIWVCYLIAGVFAAFLIYRTNDGLPLEKLIPLLLRHNPKDEQLSYTTRGLDGLLTFKDRGDVRVTKQYAKFSKKTKGLELWEPGLKDYLS